MKIFQGKHLLLGIVLVLSSIASLRVDAQAVEKRFENASIRIYSKSFSVFDVGYYIQKLRDIFFSEEFKEKYPKAVLVENFVNKMGYTSIKSYTVESRTANGKIWAKEVLELGDEFPDSLLFRMSELPDKPFKISSVFSEDDYLFLLAINNFNELGKLCLGTAQEVVSQAGPLPPEAQQIGSMLQFFQFRPELKGAFGDELDIILFDMETLKRGVPPSSPKDVFFAVMVPVLDYSRALEFVKSAGGMLGFSADKPSFASAEWKFWELLGSGVSVGLSGEWIVLTASPKRFAELVRQNATKFHEEFPRGNIFLRINTNRLFWEFGQPFMEYLRAKQPNLALKEINYFFDIQRDTDFGKIDVACSFAPGKFTTTYELDDEVINGLLAVVSAGLEFAVLEKMEREQEFEKWMKKESPPSEEEEKEREKEFEPRVPF